MSIYLSGIFSIIKANNMVRLRIWNARHYLFATMVLFFGLLPEAAIGETTHDRQTKIVFAGSSTYLPFQWLDARGQAKGFIIDLQESIGLHGEIEFEHRLGDWQEALRSIEVGEADVIALFGSEERTERFDFTVPFYYLSHSIFSHTEGEQFRSLDDLKGHSVAVVTGSYAAKRLLEEQPNFELVPVNSEFACVEAVHAGRADACIEATLISRHNAIGLKVEQTSPPFWHLPYVFGVRKGNTELLNWLNRQIVAMQADGTFFTIYQKWKPELEWRPPSIFDHLRLIALITVPLISLALLGLSASWYLKRQVEKRTRQLRYLAEHDPMTGLYNPNVLIDRLGQRLGDEPDWIPTVAFLRLRNLRSVASLFGHSSHEKLIKDFAQRLQKTDFIQTAHWGVGSFLLLAKPSMPPDKILALLNASCEIEGLRIDPDVVIGLSSDTIDADSSRSKADELVRQAILAYSIAIDKRRSWHRYAPQLEPDPNDLTLLHDANHYGTRDMHLLYQPKLDLASGYIRGAEALLRWHHPELGMISPGHFIPLLERSGLIRQVTRWVIEGAVKELARCRQHDATFVISANVAAHDLADENLVDFIGEKVAPDIREGFCLEITETGLIQDSEKSRAVITALRDAGIRCALDDFGTGYSCLVYLSRFPIDEVKLDRSFVHNILNSRRDRDIVASMIELSHTLGLKVTAEGIEDLATLKELAEMGCDTAQGYVIAKPMPAEDLYKLLGQRFFPGSFDV